MGIELSTLSQSSKMNETSLNALSFREDCHHFENSITKTEHYGKEQENLAYSEIQHQQYNIFLKIKKTFVIIKNVI